MLKIRRAEDNGTVVLVLSGRIEEPDVSELQKALATEAAGTSITLDLQEVRLVDRTAVRFLTACEARAIKLKNCASYIREWIETGATGHDA